MTALTAPTRSPVEPSPRNPHVFETALAPQQVCAHRARRDITALLMMWEVPQDLLDDVVLAVSELVTNAVQHGTGDVRLRAFNTNEQLRIEVTDDNSAPATLRAASDDDTSGRGLLLVSALAQNWGVSEDGKTTWCAFHIASDRA
ncbi:ATP-binding protein [Streptomyces sp. NPDC007162]|uniref:ATP-binding protein n=1 Tax=Streptomyces sp. NPDC007162 TaxID=3156917 RepID=UPI0033D666CC